jgi:predicted amidohydrolase
LLLLCVLVLVALQAFSLGAEGALRVAAVQLRIDQDTIGSLETYRAHMEGLVQAALPFKPDLIVFPEYTGAFLALVPYARVLGGVTTIAEGLAAVRRQEPLVRSFRDLFLLSSGFVEQSMAAVFGEMAARYGVTILAGSYFAWEEGKGEPKAGGRRARSVRLTNRAVVFGPDGQPIYTQDKVYLTPFEEDLLGVSPGRVQEAFPFTVKGAWVGVSICRDTFFEEWQHVLQDSDLWVDIKANGQAFTAEERERFQRALPARIASGGVPYGLTVCLTGRLFDLLWEGESSLVQKGPAGEATTIDRAASDSGEHLLLAEIPLL